MVCDNQRAMKYINFLTNSNKNIVAIKDNEVKGITTSNIDDIEQFLSKYGDTHNLYYNANTATQNAPNDKIKKIDIESINAIWIDLDPDKSKNYNEERLRLSNLAKELNDSELPPSYIVDSGNGIQCLWLLDEPLPYERYKDVEALMRGLNLKHGGDNTHNIDRLLRLPYTTNFPNEAKRKLGRTEKPTKVLYATQNTYSWQQLQTLATPIDAPTYDKVDHTLEFEFPPKSFPDELKQKWKNLLKEDSKLQALSKKEINFPSRSEYDFAVTQRLKQADWNINEVAILLYHFPHGKNKELCPREISRSFSRSTPMKQTMTLGDAYIKELESQTNPILAIRKHEIEQAKPKRKYKKASEVSWKKSSQPLFKGLIDEGTVVAIYGQSNVGKSFLTMDIAGHLAMGRNWDKFKLKGGKASVLSVAAEAGATYGKRTDALKRRFGLPSDVDFNTFPFAIYDEHINLLETNKNSVCEGIEELVNQAKFVEEDSGYPCKMIIIDTLSSVFGGGNENSPDDMGKIMNHLLILAKRTGATIVIVHHSGKDQSAGLRGHSKLIAGIDTALELKLSVIAGRKKRELCPRKQRDNDTELVVEFNLNVVELGVDEDGDKVESCNILLEGDSEFESIIPDRFSELTEGQIIAYKTIQISEYTKNYEKQQMYGWYNLISKTPDIEFETLKKIVNENNVPVPISSKSGLIKKDTISKQWRTLQESDLIFKDLDGNFKLTDNSF